MKKQRGFIEPALMGFISIVFLILLMPLLSSIIGAMTFTDPAIQFVFQSVPFLLVIIVVAYTFWSMGNSARGAS